MKKLPAFIIHIRIFPAGTKGSGEERAGSAHPWSAKPWKEKRRTAERGPSEGRPSKGRSEGWSERRSKGLPVIHACRVHIVKLIFHSITSQKVGLLYFMSINQYGLHNLIIVSKGLTGVRHQLFAAISVHWEQPPWCCKGSSSS